MKQCITPEQVASKRMEMQINSLIDIIDKKLCDPKESFPLEFKFYKSTPPDVCKAVCETYESMGWLAGILFNVEHFKLILLRLEDLKTIQFKDWRDGKEYGNTSDITIMLESLNENIWIQISRYNDLSEDFIQKFAGKVNWWEITYHQTLSEDFIRKFNKKVDWYNISRYQKLSEEFIREFKDKIKWNLISRYQELSEDFIRDFEDKVDWDYIFRFQTLSEEFIREFSNKRHNW